MSANMGVGEMPFEDIPCHVWAIDGYKDEGTANEVNSRYVNISNQMFDSNDRWEQGRKDRLERIMRHCRVSNAYEPFIYIIVYAGFVDEFDSAPAHMWIEHKQKIYETVPGQKLCSEAATASSREKTALTSKGYHGVVSIPWPMTVNQYPFIEN
jgi:hypothetical protein